MEKIISAIMLLAISLQNVHAACNCDCSEVVTTVMEMESQKAAQYYLDLINEIEKFTSDLTQSTPVIKQETERMKHSLESEKKAVIFDYQEAHYVEIMAGIESKRYAINAQKIEPTLELSSMQNETLMLHGYDSIDQEIRDVLERIAQ